MSSTSAFCDASLEAEVKTRTKADRSDPLQVGAPMPGLVRRVLVEAGTIITAGQPLLVLEALKMEQTVAAPAAGVVAELRAKAGEQVAAGQVLAVVEPCP